MRERREAVRLDRLDEPAVERTQLVGRRELPVAHVAPGAPGDLADLGRGQRTRADARRTW